MSDQVHKVRRPIHPGKKNGRPNLKAHSNRGKRLSERDKLSNLGKLVQDFQPPSTLTSFSELPISDFTKKGLKKAFFVKMTDIQASSIPVSLKGRDVLGAARTGSGKTLAFLVPLLEILHRQKWGPNDGLGALVISPTRELAMQIFEVLRAIGGYHSFSAGLVIGGKNLKDERDRISRMNILVATPGRLLQHLDQSVGFECGNMQMLVLDEADRILDMGFSKSLNAIMGHLPKSRQTLLFSATQTQSVKDLARLSLRNPEFVGVQEKDSQVSTPKSLEQHYLICELDKKLDILFSFIKSHLQTKVVVFMSSCKQVRFVFETFCKMHPGISLLHIHGKQKQTKRLDIYTRFTSAKHAILLATDIAARGLDFPSVDWVVQLDAPEDADTYIHRVGRTARYESKGQGLLILLPSEEEGMLERLKEKHVDVAKIKAKESKTMSIQNQLQSFAFQDPEIKYLAQRAFVSYLKSIYIQKDKSVFKLDELPIDRFAAALGLPGTPKIKFLSKDALKQKQKKNASRQLAKLTEQLEKTSQEGEGLNSEASSGSEDGDETPAGPSSDQAAVPKVRTKYDRMFERKNQGVLSEHYSKLVDHSEDHEAGHSNSNSGSENEEEDDFITIKRANHTLNDNELPSSSDLSKRKLKAGESKRQMLRYKSAGTKLTFDDEGVGHELYEFVDDNEYKKRLANGDMLEEGRKFAEQERQKMQLADVVDREEAKDKRREKKRKRKEREREAMGQQTLAEGPTLESMDEDDGYVTPDFDLPPESEDESAKEQSPAPVLKRARFHPPDGPATLEADEELALRLLAGR